MTTALATRKEAPTGMDLMTYGKMFAASGFFQDSRDAAQACVKIQAGAELGFPPVQSMMGINIIKGKVSLSANLMAAAIKRSGRYTYKVHKLDETACDLEFFESGQSLGHSTFTLADAKKAETQNLQKFARNMLFARAISNGAKWFTPDVFGGPVYTPDELGAQVDDSGEMVKQNVPQALAELPVPEDPDEMQDDEKFKIQLSECFDSRDFTTEERDAATTKALSQKKVGSLEELSVSERHGFMQAIASGKLDKFKKPVTANA